jgi:hypothetical protein
MKMQAAKIDIRNRESYNNWRDYSKQTRIYCWPKGENLMDNLMNRRSRPFAQYKKEVIPAVLEKMGLPTDTKVRWSQYAGCSCPCSPGFIVDGDSRRDVHVDVEEA